METMFNQYRHLLQPELSKEDREKIENETLELSRLAHEVFVKNKDGQKLLVLLKERMIMNCPTADPNKSTSQAYFNEGKNSTIRMLSSYAENYPHLLKESMKKKELENNKNSEDIW